MSEGDDELRISRRGALALIAGAGAGLGVLGELSASNALGAMSGSASARRGATTIMLIRHGERPGAVQPPFGVNAAGNHDSGSLAVLGWQRAGALVELFHPASGTFRSGLVRPTALFAPIPTSVSQRPLETITPTSQRTGIPVRTPVAYTADAEIAKILASTPGSPLAAWEHTNIPLIAQALGDVHPKPPTAWPGDRFDVVWVFTRRNGGGWIFKQIPQLLLHGDKDSVIQ